MSISGPQPGEHIDMDVTLAHSHRVLAAIKWDPKLSAGVMTEDVLKQMPAAMGVDLFLLAREHEGKDNHHDLDLFCYAYGEDRKMQAFIGPVTYHEIDESGKIYHSGDDEYGDFSGDDEQVYVELKGLSDDIQELVFFAACDCKSNFSDLKNPEIRIADSKSNKNFLHVDLNPADDSNIFVFCRMYRDGKGWKLHSICQYGHTSEVEEWDQYIQKFL